MDPVLLIYWLYYNTAESVDPVLQIYWLYYNTADSVDPLLQIYWPNLLLTLFLILRLWLPINAKTILDQVL